MTEQDKVTVDDIIGIVKTEEQTNSVEEVRKLRGRGNETAKRFFILIDDEDEDDLPCIRDRTFKIKDIYGHYRYDDLEEICNEFNRLVDKNEQLKTTIQQLRTDNTKQKKLLNTTMKENEHIKQTIKDMINTERTELGKMTLRHLWRQIQ